MTTDLRARVEALAPWFHNLRLGDLETAPAHYLGDYPMVKWKRFAHAVPRDLTGKSVLDIGCNAGFYSFEMKRRGAARVVGLDADERYLAQARLAAEVLDMQDVEFRRSDVYQVGALGERFDVVLFMGVFYHLRHPLLALDLIREHAAADLLLFQSMIRGSRSVHDAAPDYGFEDTLQFNRPGWPKLHFIEHAYAKDPTNWWIPNRACVEAMLRSAGFTILQRPELEVYLCRVAGPPGGEGAAHPAGGAAS